MQSYRMLRPTTNPYIHMLDAALAQHDGIEHRRFDRRTALLGRYDVLHLHWPETMFDGSTPIRRLLRRMYATALVLRLRFGRRTAVVRTAHNVGLPRDVGPWERRLLQMIEDCTDLRIVLNEETDGQGTPTVWIPHGHYRDWFATVPQADPQPHSLGFVGLVRRYKGLEQLLDVFAATAGSRPDLELHLSGNPTSAELRQRIEHAAGQDRRIVADLRFLSEADFATAIMSVRGVVLPYRFMHNSGAALAALSLDRPVLVPDNAVNRALADEVGPGWVHTFRGELSVEDLLAFDSALDAPHDDRPDLTARSWSGAGASHERAFAEAVAHRRAGR